MRFFATSLIDISIFSDDILRAVAKLKSLGSGFAALSVGDGRYVIQSVPGELTMDHARILEAAQVGGSDGMGTLPIPKFWVPSQI